MWALARCLGLLMLVMLLAGARLAQAADEAEFLAPERAFQLTASQPAADLLELHFKVAPGYYLYRERFELSGQPVEAINSAAAVFPTGEVKYDPTFDKDMEVYHHDVVIRVPLALTGQPARLRVTSQGCADAGLCYPPMSQQVALTPEGASYAVNVSAIDPGQMAERPEATTAAAPTAAPATGQPTASGSGLGALLEAGDVGLAGALGGLGVLGAAGVFFVLGLLLAFTPCVLPMIPILSSIIVGRDAQVVTSKRRGLGLAAAYVLGMSVVYTVLGVAAGLSGAGLAAWLQTPWVLVLFALLLALLALAMFDAYILQLPAAWQARLSERSNRVPGGRYTGAWFMGAISALIVGPCVAAPLAGALLYISQTGDVWLGGAALFAMAWGMGVPLLVVGASSGALLPRAGAWMDGVKRFFGMVLLATAWWMLIPILPAWLLMLGWAVLASVGAVMLRAFEPLPADAGAARMFAKGIGLLFALGALVWVVGAASGARDALVPLGQLAARTQIGAPRDEHPSFTRIRTVAELDAALAASTRPVMLDFYADWCVSCREMERFTFSDPGVAQRMAGMLLLQADVTQNNAEDRALLKRFKLFGPPGILFFAPGGRLLEQPRVVGFQDAARFSASLDQAAAEAQH
ncbi:protein-disulfide reductase DsbD [Bordetella holmesii]|nr:protein-disulfide reductase DsbD [Bordetella holmesii]AMD45191.1 protein-disulfide reductase [Bordetella holmesii H558]AOB34078.1 protein-disulfide reductase [Bordetella holmesii]AUL18100.1 protein-disulfide reductase DsbD [Bordetella holmesii]AUL21412.1 protein-disulfide reductase DsbD [Bordetella holmesii]AUL24735.1 protein-disulfide reductase DsbD [Bordetella holmesii]